MEDLISQLNGIIWSPALVYLCLGAGLFFSILTRFVQVRLFGEMVRLLFSGKASQSGISSFQALAVSLAGRVGMGNIAGVAAAIGFGGPGAVFWMWVVAFLGASTAFAESTLAQIYKEKDDVTGEYRGGPAYYFEKALGLKIYGIIFAFASIIACGIFLPGVQANGVVNAITQVFGEGSQINTGIFGEIGAYRLIGLGIILVVLATIIFGGIKRIAHFTQLIVPFMAIGYIVLALVIMVLNFDQIPHVFGMIIGDAFTAQAGFGAAIGWGVKRGIYSNEAGQGTGPHAAGAAEVDHPAQQGLVQAFSVYVDTLFICSATAFMILSTGLYNIKGTLEDGFLVQNVDAAIEINSPAFTQMAMEATFGTFGDTFIAVAIFFFAFTTILAYYYIAEVNITYLTRFFGKDAHKAGLFVVKVLIMLMVAYGGINSAGYIWNMGDVGVGLMAWLNIIGIIIIFLVSKPAIAALKDYEQQRKAGVSKYTYDPEKFGINNAPYWKERNNK